MKRIKAMTINGKSLKDCKLGGGWLMRSETGEYEVLEWIESTGTQWFTVPNVTVDDYTRASVKFSVVRNPISSSWIILCGMREATNKTLTFAYKRYNDASEYLTIDMANRVAPTQTLIAVGDVVDVAVVANNTNGTDLRLYLNDFLWYINNKISWVYTSDFGVFCFVNDGTVDNRHAYARVYSVNFQSDTSHFSLAPARRIADGEVGMYDTVSQTFFTNQGSGAFIPGPATGDYI